MNSSSPDRLIGQNKASLERDLPHVASLCATPPWPSFEKPIRSSSQRATQDSMRSRRTSAPTTMSSTSQAYSSPVRDMPSSMKASARRNCEAPARVLSHGANGGDSREKAKVATGIVRYEIQQPQKGATTD